MPPAPALPPGPWVASIAATFTAFASPAGTVFTRNLTPDKETGLGDWTVEEFIATMKTGRERGKGRPVLPPMPVQNLQGAQRHRHPRAVRVSAVDAGDQEPHAAAD